MVPFLLIGGIAIWAVVLRYSATFAYGDVERRRRFWIGVGALCFAAAGALWLVKAAHG